MPITAEQERNLLNQYHLTTLYPTEWPREHDNDDSEDDLDDDSSNTLNGAAGNHLRDKSTASSVSRFQKISRHASLRSSLTNRSGSTKEDAGVQKDESDALGMAPSVAAELRKRGLPVEENLALRNRFMLSSTTFNPALYLAHVHQHSSTADLLRGLDFLSRSIEQKSASLKILVESNFERFVRAKATIDSVYTEMRTQGAEQAASPALGTVTTPNLSNPMRPHSRHTSRGQSHFRNTSGAFGSQGRVSLHQQQLAVDKKKTALTKESEYGVAGIKTPLLEVAIKAEEVWGPALGGREKEETLKAVTSALEQHREIFRLSGTIFECIKKNDYDGVLEAYRLARGYVEKARRIAQTDGSTQMSEADVQQILVTARMWHDVTAQLEEFKHEIWKRLKTSHARRSPAAVAAEGGGAADKEQHMELIALLLQLGVDENPIWEWINSKYLYLKDKIARSFERSRIEIEIQRRRLTHNTKVDAAAQARYLRSASTLPGTMLLSSSSATSSLRVANKDSNSSATTTTRDMDSPAILAFWEKVLAALTGLLSPTAQGILGEVLEWWDTAQRFIRGQAQKSFPAGVFAAGLEHLELDPTHVQNIRAGALELMALLREAMHVFFAEPPVEDLSELYSPVPETPTSPGSARTPTSGIRRTLTLDPAVIPPLPASKRDGSAASGDKFAFWAPGSNSLSSSHYLARLLALVGTAAGEMASLELLRSPSAPANSSGGVSIETLKSLVTLVRERCITALCAAWLADAEHSRVLESWQRSPERRDLTLMPLAFEAWMETVLSNVQRLAYVSTTTASATSGAPAGSAAAALAAKGLEKVVVPPPAKLLSVVRGTFVTGLYKGLSGMVENAEGKSKKKGDGPEGENGSTQEEEESVVVKRTGTVAALRGLLGAGGEEEITTSGLLMEAVDGENKSVRLLLTLSNFAHLRTVAIPHLIQHFETLFSVKLTDESKTLRDVLSQIDARLFQSYTAPTVDELRGIITAGISSPTWSSTSPGNKPKDVKPYIYQSLLALVLVHAEVSNTISPTASGAIDAKPTPSPLIHQILSHHLLHASQVLLSTFRTRPSFTLSDLIQATLDVEFFSQTLAAYTSDAASLAQSELYLAMDERTDHDARSALQGELPEMRGVLKKLKEGTKGEFACFKAPRSSGAGGHGRGRSNAPAPPRN